MAIQPAHVEFRWSLLRKKTVEVCRLYEDGFLYLVGDPGLWIQSNPGCLLSSVRSLELDLWLHEVDRIGDSIGELSQLTHLCIREGLSLKFLPNTISRLQNLYHLEVCECWELVKLPENLGDLHNLASLTLSGCRHLKSLPNSVAKLSRLTTLSIVGCEQLQVSPANFQGLQNLISLSCISYPLKSLPDSVANLSKLTTLNLSGNNLEELPANLGDLELLTTLYLDRCDSLRTLPWSITKLFKLRFLYLPKYFRLATLPPHLNDSIMISVKNIHVRKSWKELKTEIQFPIIPVELADEAPWTTPVPGYLRFNGDPKSWILENYSLYSSARILDLNLSNDISQWNIPASIGELPQLTHLYISYVRLHHLPVAFNRITHLSLFYCTFQCDTDSHFNSLGKLSNLISLHLRTCYVRLSEHMDFPISLRHLTLDCPFTDRYMASMAKLTNLETLNLCEPTAPKSISLNLKLNKLILRNNNISSVSICLKHLEIIHQLYQCLQVSCAVLPKCLNQAVNLETLSCTCYTNESFASVTSLHNLRELRLKDCFNLKQLPPHLDEMVKLCSLNVSGTRIKSLPNSIMKLHNLRLVILPKCFNLKSLPHNFENKVKISVDDTDESYYKHEGYYHPHFETYDEEDPIISDSIGGVNEIVLEESRQEAITESGSSHRPLNHQVPDDSQIVEGSHFTGRKDPISNNNSHAFSSSLNHQTEFFPAEKEDGIVPSMNDCLLHFQENAWQVHASREIEVNDAVSRNSSYGIFSTQNQEIQNETSHSRDRGGVVTFVNSIVAEPCSNIQETILCCENSQEAFQNGGMDNVDLELEQEMAPCETLNHVHRWSNCHAFKNRQDNNSQRDYVKHNTQKKEVPLGRIRELMSQNIRLEDAGKHLGVSRSTLKRALKQHKLIWPSTRKRKNPDKNRNETHDTTSSSGRIFSQLNSVGPSNPAGLGQGAGHFDVPNQLTMSDHVPFVPNVVNELNSDLVIRTVEEPPMSTQWHMDGGQRDEEHPNGAKECVLANTDIHPNERSSTFVVKATCNEDTARFNFSLSSSIEQLKEEVSKSLDLEVGTFKMKYQDDENEWMIMNRISDLELALSLSKASGSNVVRLLIVMKT